MHINYDKTNYMILGRTNKQNVPQEFDIRIHEKHIKKTQNHKLLCIHTDDKLFWSSHIDHLYYSISSKISLLRQLSKYVSTGVQKCFIKDIFCPLLIMDEWYGELSPHQTLAEYLNSKNVLQE